MSTLTTAKHPATTTKHRMTTGIIGALNHEWDRLCENPASNAEIALWAEREPALDDLQDLANLPALAFAASDAVLSALIRLAHDGRDLAGRSVLQLMMPKIVRIAMSQINAYDGFEETCAITVAATWDVISGYSLHARPTGIAGQLALDTLKRVVDPTRFGLGGRRAESRGDTRVHLWGDLADIDLDPYRDPAPVALQPRLRHRQQRLAQDGDEEPEGTGATGVALLKVLVRAVNRSVITRAEAQILAQVYLCADSHSGATVAEHLGLSRTALRKRCSRIVERMQLHADSIAA